MKDDNKVYKCCAIEFDHNQNLKETLNMAIDECIIYE